MRIILCFVVLATLLLNFSPSWALRCYQCEEFLGQGLHCESNVKSVLQPNCTEGFVCIKYIYGVDNSSMIHRGCAPESKCAELSASLTELKYCGTCSTALCNSAPTSHFELFTWLTVAYFIFMYNIVRQ